MLKYLYYKEIFKEVPNEITLGISISGCQIRCPGCHSRELWEDKGTTLTPQSLEVLLQEHKGITCLCLFGGEHDIETLIELFKYAHTKVKTAWYAGLDLLPKNHLDYLKLGHFDIELGGLNSPTTNQKLYKIEHQGDGNYYQTDITHLLQNN